MEDGKLQALSASLMEMGSVAVAFSGGVDSSLLLKVAHDCLGDRAVAMTAVSPSVPRHELDSAGEVARLVGARHILIDTNELEDERYASNPANRCYFCKTTTYEELIPRARELGCAVVVDGNNADDLGDVRPGRLAASEHGVRSPLQELGITKAEIRDWARQLGLPNWDMPSAACLSSRVPYGNRITPEVLGQIDRAEQALRRRGLRQVRVRHHDRIARIEVEPADLPALVAAREEIVVELRALGYTYVTLDLAGFRSGSMNEVISLRGR